MPIFTFAKFKTLCLVFVKSCYKHFEVEKFCFSNHLILIWLFDCFCLLKIDAFDKFIFSNGPFWPQKMLIAYFESLREIHLSYFYFQTLILISNWNWCLKFEGLLNGRFCWNWPGLWEIKLWWWRNNRYMWPIFDLFVW